MNLATKNTNDFKVTTTGEAFISQRKCAELCGISQSTLNEFFRSNNLNVSQGVSSNSLNFSITHYANKGRCEAVQTLILFSKAGAKAYIYHEAGYELTAKPKMTQLEMLAEGFANMARLEAEQSKQAADIAEIKERQDQLDGDTQYMTALAYCRKHKIPAPLKVANKLGRDCASYCREHSIKIGTVPDERWGSVNSYPVRILNGLHK